MASSGDQQAAHDTLERLLEIPVTDLRDALIRASDLVAAALRADKVDAFVFEPERNSLFAIGTSNQPLSQLQRALGLDLLPIANGGRTVEAFRTGRTHHSHRLDLDPDELRGLKDALGIRSTISVPLEVGGERRGVLVVASQTPEFFSPGDVRFAESVAGWIGIVAHHAELVAAKAADAAAEVRRTVADELVTVLAHDLRNQLAPITLRLTTIRDRAVLDRRAADSRELDLCLKGLARLGALTSDMLDVARIDQGVFTIDLQPVDLVALTRDTSATFTTAAHPVEHRAEAAVSVLGDPARLRQCLENLVSNAIKHSPAGAAVTTVVAVEQRDTGSWACIHVIDQGPGIAPELLPHIFDRFTKGGARHEGLGLGLYLAKCIAQSHRGELSVDSRPGRGAHFKLCLPHGADR